MKTLFHANPSLFFGVECFFIAIFAQKMTVLPRNVETTNRQKDVTKITNMRRKLQKYVFLVNKTAHS